MSFRINPLHEKKRRFSVREKFPKLNLTKLSRMVSLGMTIGAPLWRLGQRALERREHEKRVKRVIMISLTGGAAILIIVLALMLFVKIGAVSVSSLMQMSGKPVAVDGHGATNILLLGQGNEDHDGIDLTDTIIIASIEPERSKSVVLLSLPRDLHFLHTNRMLLDGGRLNALWRDERIELQRVPNEHCPEPCDRNKASMTSLIELRKEIGDALGMDIHYVVKVDFTAVEKSIDAIGGIDIVVPETIHDTEFPGPNYTYQTFHIDAGLQNLDGATALKYARSRSTTSDFDRSSRQQQILQAAAEQAREAGFLQRPGKLLDLYGILQEHVETDLTTRQLVTMASAAKKLQQENMVTMQLTDINGLYGEPLAAGGLLYAPPRDLFEGASVFLPVSIPEFPVTWKQIRVLSELLFRNRSLYLSAPRIAILNAGAPEGSARNLSREFIKFGFDVVEIANLPGGQKIDSSVVLKTGAELPISTAQFFAETVKIPLEEVSEEWNNSLDGVDPGTLAIILGRDYSFDRFQDLIPTVE